MELDNPGYGTIEHNKRWNDHPQFQTGGELWSGPWGGSDYLWHCTILPRIFQWLPAERILEIAPGHGRCTHYLKDHAQKVIAVDLNPVCVEKCRQRFSGISNIEVHLNDGKSLDMVKDHSIDFIFSWDSLVHAQPDALEPYAKEFARVLRPGGAGFIHHSNLACLLKDKGRARIESRFIYERASKVDAVVFRELCEKAGLSIVRQETIGWKNPYMIDCLSTFRKGDTSDSKPHYLENPTFFLEQRVAKQIALFYGPADGGANAEQHLNVEKAVLAEVFRWVPENRIMDHISISDHVRYLLSRLTKKLRSGGK